MSKIYENLSVFSKKSDKFIVEKYIYLIFFEYLHESFTVYLILLNSKYY